MAAGGQGLQPLHPCSTASVGELLVEALPDPSAAVVWVNPDQMDVPSRGRSRNENAEEKPDHVSVELRDERMLTKLVEEHGISTTTRRPAPPLVEHGDDIVKVRFGEAPDSHLRNSG